MCICVYLILYTSFAANSLIQKSKIIMLKIKISLPTRYFLRRYSTSSTNWMITFSDFCVKLVRSWNWRGRTFLYRSFHSFQERFCFLKKYCNIKSLRLDVQDVLKYKIWKFLTRGVPILRNFDKTLLTQNIL